MKNYADSINRPEMRIIMNKKIISLYSIIQFIVDLACAILVTHFVTKQLGNTINLFIAILLYNFFAFAIQLPIGIIADFVNKNAICSSIGCILVALAFGLNQYGIIACIIAGIGNAMFHVGGGIDVLNISDKKAFFSGIYVSTGALGIFLGSNPSLLKFNLLSIMVFIIILLLFSSILLCILYCYIKNKVINKKPIIPSIHINEYIVIISLIITVCIRSYIGLILSFQWKNNFILALLTIIAVILGKMLGGFIGDIIGFTKISIISLTVSSICFIFAFNNPFFGILAILFFNMTMPITLTALSNILDNNKGIAFGLLTLALFIGGFPVYFGYNKLIFTPIGLFITTLISAIILYIGLHKYSRYMEATND